METNEEILAHYGIPTRSGRRPWGSGERPYQRLGGKKGLGSGRGSSGKGSKKRTEKKTSKSIRKRKIKLKDMSDADLTKAIKRLEMEKKYKDLKRSQLSTGRKIVGDILKKSTSNIGEQLATYGMGRLVNKALRDIAKENVVNPKKGQKK